MVLAALVNDVSYEGLAIADGEAASRLYYRFVVGDLQADKQAPLFDDLRAYCGTDTMAMVRLYQVLCQAVETGSL